MGDLPAGEWSPLLVGHQWPAGAALAALAASADNRAATAAAHDRYAETLRSIRNGPLAEQQGITAESARQLFRTGADYAQSIAETNETKGDSYRWAHRYVAELRSALSDIADSGNAEIRRTLDSNRPLAEKVGAIVSTITDAQNRANAKAAECSANLLGVIETTLGTRPAGLSAREFSSANGVDLSSAFRSPTAETLHPRVEAALRESASGAGTDLPPTSSAGTPDPGVTVRAAETPPPEGNIGGPAGAGPGVSEPGPVSLPPAGTEHVPPAESGGSAHAAGPASESRPNGANPGDLLSEDGITELDISEPDASGPDVSGPDVSGPDISGPDASGPDASEPEVSEPDRAGLPAALTEPHPTIGADPAGGDAAVPSGETGTPATASIPAPADPAPPEPGSGAVVAPVTGPGVRPAVPAVPPTAGVSTPAPHGLPTYGADLRPPATTSPPGPHFGPAAPVSAPVGVGGVTGAGGQSVVVRRDSAPAAGLTARRASAGVGGEPVGDEPDGAPAEDRLRRLVGSVARQQPQLRWGIGDLEDGSTVVVTDIAGGWIPPGIAIPVGVRPLPPARRSGDLAALIGPATRMFIQQPGEQCATTEHGEPVPMATQTWQRARVDDFGWELARATQWRDGLPRLAHTLAKAGTARSGYLDSEIALLRDYLVGTRRSALSRYPDEVNHQDIGNWQLLASIEAHVLGETGCAGYHLAWFLASTAAPRTVTT